LTIAVLAFARVKEVGGVETVSC